MLEQQSKMANESLDKWHKSLPSYTFCRFDEDKNQVQTHTNVLKVNLNGYDIVTDIVKYM